MNWLRSIAQEVIGLFVDDGSFAAAILIWLAIALAVLPKIAAAARWTVLCLFAGLGIILIESVLRYARRRRK